MNTHRLFDGSVVFISSLALLLIGHFTLAQAVSTPEIKKPQDVQVLLRSPATTFTVTHVAPANATLNVARDVTISAGFNQPVDSSTVSTRTFTVRGNQTGVYTGTYGGVLSDTLFIGLVQFDPAQNFKPGEEILVYLSNGLRTADGTPLTPYAWSFQAAVLGGGGVFADSGQRLGNADSYGMALGDLDGDDDLDAFVANWIQAGTDNWYNRVWLNDGKGTFSDSGQRLGDTASSDIALGDLDADGDLDAFVANLVAPNRVWLNDGGVQGGIPGAFSDSGQRLGGSVNSWSAALGDLDGDGDLDVFVANDNTNTIWQNDGAGTFSDSGQNLGSSDSQAVALGDLDSDGDLDAFVTNWNSQPNRVWLNDGLGTFTATQSLGNADSLAVALGDVDGDGDLDAFVANFGANKVWLTDGTGIFSDSGQSLGSAGSMAVVLGDVDGDGDLDAFVANGGTQANKVWLNDGTGIFNDSDQSLGGSDSWDVALGKLDGDGDLDAFVVNSLGQANEVWLNQETLADFYIYLPLAVHSFP